MPYRPCGKDRGGPTGYGGQGRLRDALPMTRCGLNGYTHHPDLVRAVKKALWAIDPRTGLTLLCRNGAKPCDRVLLRADGPAVWGALVPKHPGKRPRFASRNPRGCYIHEKFCSLPKKEPFYKREYVGYSPEIKRLPDASRGQKTIEGTAPNPFSWNDAWPPHRCAPVP